MRYPGAASGELEFTLISGGRRSGRVRNALACPGPLGRGGGPGARGRLTAEYARQQDAGGRESPEKPSTVILPPSLSLLARFFAKPVLSSARCRRTRPQARKPSVLQPDPLRRATRRVRATPVIFHENPQVCNILPSPDQGGVRHHRHP